ncbi:unnamed protein product [Prorocentrum cordatum]|uniref:Uncharacterized protein n=1 Tax=Prorocentrum cordatum TaxID=2364126 RepID=A0ABN9TK99_9DINO|nr:unnamed protein product [Polarella glacialis]
METHLLLETSALRADFLGMRPTPLAANTRHSESADAPSSAGARRLAAGARARGRRQSRRRRRQQLPLVPPPGPGLRAQSESEEFSEVGRPPTLARRFANWPVSVREGASRPSCLRVQHHLALEIVNCVVIGVADPIL